MALFPGPELTMAAWLAQVPGMTGAMTGDRFPDAASIPSSGFVRTTVIGGSQHPYTGMQQPAIQLDVLCVQEDSQEVPWHQSRDICQRIMKEAARMVPVQVSPGATWNDALVRQVNIASDPRRMESREGYALYQLDCQLYYTEVQ